MHSVEPLLARYRQDRRCLQPPGFVREDLSSVVRYLPTQQGTGGMVLFADLPNGEADHEIQRQIEFFRRLGIAFEWKVYGADRPVNLRERLKARGFTEGESEALLIYDSGRARSDVHRNGGGVEIRRLEDPAQLRLIVDIQVTTWKRPFDWLESHLRSMWAFTSFHVAYSGREAVGCGYIEFPEGSRFAELHGGAVLPGNRGRGIYSQLFNVRMLEAQRRGVKWVAADAAPMSRPILLAKGFEQLDVSWPMTWAPEAST